MGYVLGNGMDIEYPGDGLPAFMKGNVFNGTLNFFQIKMPGRDRIVLEDRLDLF